MHKRPFNFTRYWGIAMSIETFDNYEKNRNITYFKNLCFYPLLLGRRTQIWSFFLSMTYRFSGKWENSWKLDFLPLSLKILILLHNNNIANISYFLYLSTFFIKITEKLTFYCEKLSKAFASFLIPKHAMLSRLMILHEFLGNLTLLIIFRVTLLSLILLWINTLEQVVRESKYLDLLFNHKAFYI